MSRSRAQRTDMEGVLGALGPARTGPRVKSGDPTYHDIVDFLVDEALLLDHNQIEEWYELLAEDLVYRMPVRRTVYRDQGPGFDPVMGHFDEGYETMTARIKRLRSNAAWAEDPPSRVRRFVSNVRVDAMESPGEFSVTSYVLALRSQWTKSEFDIVSMERHDVLRRNETSFKIARRIIYLDQSALGTSNLSIFF
jgi:3-phenylpropionate/cinnamic acid dioxygenase small subunit